MKLRSIVPSVLMATSVSAMAGDFTLTSTDIAQGKTLSSDHVYQGFGCSGGNLSPQLSWNNAPEGTKAFAVFAYDPDAPTGSGWWHWQIVNIPSDVNTLPKGIGTSENQHVLGATQYSNDYGEIGFGGACPPKGHGPHRYQFTVHALSKVLDLPENPTSAIVGYMVNGHTIDTASIEAIYEAK
ncbi:YbhB/YbcL family Raf kinase inhibitor-like protein [Marinomonas communis]|uniref:YbhB/YbcL family Raf kinase inhibitor-like protein n=1 Tax=Marinomonas communis TaxID=28254 RepID=UPI00100093C3|nr:YbhB/YbcL family Raf kinase inhibitor-like protein [Marinomonas communis]MCC4273070.1 YbhB/YbcL family Raf kinase inhibitor-like protein [Marinomonas communis]RUM48769.1 MAG: YbhB/YbcL family Raf kinase inhibitor-like protein [Marinomonas sp.]RUM60376.1 MAG: YbhB/YbcL family Raf kinase inhibitor-like protein [Persephonella sp.]